MFNKYPVNTVQKRIHSHLQTGYDFIINRIFNDLENNSDMPVFAFDGTNGADFHKLLQHVVTALEKRNYSVDVQSTASYINSGSKLRELFNANITDNRAFGYVIEGGISQYFAADARTVFSNHLKNGAKSSKNVCIVFGPGAYWLTNELCDHFYFLDVSREYQQIEYKGELLNFGLDWNRDFAEKYKIAYFVEWPILENNRKSLLNKIDVYVDMNQPDNPVSINGSGLKEIIGEIVRRPLRVKPFFAPGIWGGQRLKQLADLPENWKNCAWSFEPIAPENSILIRYKENTIEVPFLIVMALEHIAVMGERPVKLFGDYFPIRFDYLDTIDGDNLSCQVHPKQEYITEKFNEMMEQQESYYIMEKKGNSKVYLGLTNDCTSKKFRNAVTSAQESEVPVDVTDYVNEFNTEKGDLFLIPTGTVHFSGKDNLVLEISSTTWWFTFKIYDFLRKDLDGKPRPLNIKHGFANIDFYKTTNWTEQNLIPKPKLLNKQGDNEEYLLGQRNDLLFFVHRIHLQNEWRDNTDDEFVMLNLVEGESVRIISSEDESIYVELSYAESYILPSVFGEYRVVNTGTLPCKLIKTGVSPDWDVSLVEG